MEHNRVFCLYYPTTTVFVDDNKPFLENIQLNIGHRTPCVLYSDSTQALKAIQKAIQKNNDLRSVVDIDTESSDYARMSSKLPIRYNISNIFKHIYNNARFSEVSVIVVDFEMPNLNGEELCKLLRKNNPLTKIIMLSGEADDVIAVRLFNEGLIDQFIYKGRPGWDNTLINSIKEMQKRYFEDLTTPIIKVLAYDQDSSLGDPAFIDLVNQIYSELSASSYYLFELSGSFLFFDDLGTPTWLIVKTLDELKETADEIDAPKSLIKAMKKGEVVPYFSKFEDCFDNQKQDLEKHFYKAKILKGKKDYCYALIKDQLLDFPLDRDKILSFNEYLSQN